MQRLPNYGLPGGYRHRQEPAPWDDRHLAGEFQRPVYELAANVMADHDLHSVLDVGCGSGWKLVHLLGSHRTIGTELEPMLSHCRHQYPDRDWLMSDFSTPCPVECVDLVLCADVIEHLSDPDLLLGYLAGIPGWRLAVISTPDRDAARGPGDLGPPENVHHAREWAAGEFARYVGQWFPVIRHSAYAPNTQAVVCRPAAVTVITSCYNTPGRMIDECAASMDAQSLSAWEWIVVDDGSTHAGTVAALDLLAAHPRVRLIRFLENRGLPTGLNTALRACRTDWAARLDPDDVAMPEWLESQAAAACDLPPRTILGCQIELFEHGTDKTLGRTRHPDHVTQEVIDRQAAEGCVWFINHPGVIYRPEEILSLGGGYDESYRSGHEDYELWMRAFRAGWSILNQPRVLQRYRRWKP